MLVQYSPVFHNICLTPIQFQGDLNRYLKCSQSARLSEQGHFMTFSSSCSKHWDSMPENRRLCPEKDFNCNLVICVLRGCREQFFTGLHFVEFSTQKFSAFIPLGTTGTLIFHRQNPADRPQSDDNGFIISQNLIGKLDLDDFYLHNQ